METGWVIAVGIIALLVGGFLGVGLFPRVVEVVKEVPVAGECADLDSVVCDPEIVVEEKDYKAEALQVFLEEIEDDDDLQECDSDEYDIDQVKVKKVYDDWSVEYDDEEPTVYFTVKLKYLDGDVEDKCYAKYNVDVFYEEDEDPEVDWELV